MLCCPRDLFVPPPHRAEALADRPIRVEAAGFNISAPHVQVGSCEAQGGGRWGSHSCERGAGNVPETNDMGWWCGWGARGLHGLQCMGVAKATGVGKQLGRAARVGMWVGCRVGRNVVWCCRFLQM